MSRPAENSTQQNRSETHIPLDAPPLAVTIPAPEKAKDGIGPSFSESQYQAIFETSSDGLIINDLETGVVLEANPAACRMHGYEQMIGLHPTVFIHPNNHQTFDAYLRALQKGVEFRCRAQDVCRDGVSFDVEVTGRGFTYQGKPAILSVIRDISDEVRAMQILEERVAERTSEIERRRMVAEGLRDLLAVVNSRLTLDEILEYIVAQSRQLLDCDACAIFLPFEEHDGVMLRIRAASGLELAYKTVRLPVNLSSTGLAFSHLQPVAVSDLQDVLPDLSTESPEIEFDERPAYIQISRLPSILDDESGSDLAPLRAFAAAYGALLALPLAVKDERYGALSLYYRQPRDFDDDHIALATAFADQTALVLENARLREQAEQAAVFEDRQHLARELHDAVTQTLFSANLIAEVLPELWDTNPVEARQRLAQLRRLARGALAEMRLLLVELRPQVLTDHTLGDLLRQLGEAASGSTGAGVTVRMEGPSTARLPAEVQAAFFRIAQESLNNIVKHAQATRVDIFLLYESDGGVRLEIRDDGRGFNVAANEPGHLGLGIMRERAQDIDAVLRIDSQIERGTWIELTWRCKDRSTT